MKGKEPILIEQQTLSPGPPEDCESESLSLSDSYVYSETESIGESVGSVNMAGCSEPTPSFELGSPRRRKKKKGGVKFLQFSMKLPEVPVQVAWAFIRDHKLMASLVPGIIEGFEFIEGEGGTGSISIVKYNRKFVKPGDEPFLINKVEVNDEESKLFAIRCVGGKYMKVYNMYVTYCNVSAHDVDGDSSSVVGWRLEYDLIDPNSPPPEYTKRVYLTSMELITERYHAMNRVERPLVVPQAAVVNVTKRLRVAARQKRLTGAGEQQEPEDCFQRQPQDRSEQRRRKRKGKGKAQQARVNDDEGSDRESRVAETPWWKAISKIEPGGRRGRFNNEVILLQESGLEEDDEKVIEKEAEDSEAKQRST